ncbi:MAG: right-handed parallel beta-helix repeat-containing protein [Saprospiraceae bacterium]|nr:right-handed parallel beta-helix repeat-containing protein [Saprospiraceae bacterium]
MKKLFLLIIFVFFFFQLNSQTISTFPHLETFSSFTTSGSNPILTTDGNWWFSSTSIEPMWELEAPTTGVDLNTSFTGPIWDHTTIGVAGGRYVFLETDNGSLGSFSYLTSPNLNYSPNQILKLSFWYHMYGSAIGSLEVEQYVNGGWMSTGWHKTGQQHTTGVAAWTEAQIVLNSAATKIRFKGARGNSYTGDIAIDDIYFSIVTTNNSGISNINAPGGIITPGSYNININIKNFGTDTLSSATIKYSVNGGTIYSYSWSGSIDSGATLSNITIGNHTFIAGQSDLLVWTESPNGVTDQDMDNDTAYLSVYACNSLSGVYLIGKTNSDFPTINDAISAIQSCNISGSVTFNISPDVYNENILLQPISGLSSTKTVTFQSLTGNPNDVIIKHSSVNSSSNYVVKLNGADYFKFKNLTLQSLNPNYGIVVEIKADANNNEFSGNRLIGVSTTKTNEVMAVIISDNSIDNYNVIQNNEIKNGSYGVCFKGASSTVLEQGLIISNNTITNFVKYGIFIQYSNSINITSNLIKSNIANDKYGIYIENGDNAQNISSNNIQLEGSGWLYGIYLKNCDGTTANPGKVFNNFVTLYDATSSLEGITSFTCNYQNYYFNSVHVSTTGSNGYCFIHGGGNVNIVNNILSNTGKGYTFYISGNFTVSTVDYNNLYCTDSILAYWGGNRATLNDLKLFSGKNMHSKSVNPHFVSSSDLHINNQLLNGMGTTIAGITTDIDGDTRSSPPDIGADEFYPLSSDAGISDYLGPFGSCPGYPDSVTVKLKNYGYANLTNVTVNWKVNGVLKTPFNWTGILPAYSDTDITIGTHTFLSNSNSNMVFWTTNPNSVTDLNNTNDTLNSINIPMAMAPGTYIIGSGPSADFSSFNEAITAMYSYGICGSITFNVESGTYTEQVYLNELFGLDSGRTVTFKSLTGNPNDVVLMYDATYLPNNCVINFDGADYFQFKNMTIKATSNISSKVIFLTNNACYNEISNNIIINNSNQPNIHVIGSLSNNNKILNNEILNGTYGIHIESSNTISAEGNTILGNNISNFTTCGIKVTYNNSLTIDSNTISLNQQVYNSEGIVLNNCDSGLFVVRNRINSSVIPISSGIVLEFCDGTSSSPSFVANNFISQSYSASNKFYGIELHSSNHINIYYNSVNITAGSYNSTAIYQYNGSNLNIVNNNFVNVGGGYAIWSNQPSSISNLDYNNYYVSGNYIAYWGYHTYYATLASFKTASNKDFNSISVNPMFPSLQNLHLNSSSLNGAGTPLSGIYDDIDGDTRSSTAPDIGADEYDIVFNDAGISALIHPNVACLGVNNIIVKL